MKRWRYEITKLGDLTLVSLYYNDFAVLDVDSEDIPALIDTLKEIQRETENERN